MSGLDTAKVLSSLCQAFDLHEIGAGRWAVESPMLYDDGDGLPVIIVDGDDGWHITDDGMAVSHLFFGDFEHTEARLKRIALLVNDSGARLGETHALIAPLDGPPTAYDIGDFLQLVSQVEGAAKTMSVEREAHQYQVQVRSSVIKRLKRPEFDENWAPELSGLRANYKADLRVPADGNDIALFAASTSDRVSVAALTVHHFREAKVEFTPLLAYHPDKVTSEAIYRFQDEVGNDLATISTPPDDVSRLVASMRSAGAAV